MPLFDRNHLIFIESSFYRTVSEKEPLPVKDRGLQDWFLLMFGPPFFFRSFNQVSEFMIAEQVLPGKADQVREGYFLFDPFLDDGKE